MKKGRRARVHKRAKGGRSLAVKGRTRAVPTKFFETRKQFPRTWTVMTRSPRGARVNSFLLPQRNTSEVLWRRVFGETRGSFGGFDHEIVERQRGGSPRNVKSDPRLRSLLRQIAEKGLYPSAVSKISRIKANRQENIWRGRKNREYEQWKVYIC